MCGAISGIHAGCVAAGCRAEASGRGRFVKKVRGRVWDRKIKSRFALSRGIDGLACAARC